MVILCSWINCPQTTSHPSGSDLMDIFWAYT